MMFEVFKLLKICMNKSPEYDEIGWKKIRKVLICEYENICYDANSEITNDCCIHLVFNIWQENIAVQLDCHDIPADNINVLIEVKIPTAALDEKWR